MKIKIVLLLLAGFLAMNSSLRAQMDTNGLDAKELAQLKKVYDLVKNLKYQQGEIDLKGGLAKLTVPADFRFLGPADAETVLVKLWGNPPSDEKPRACSSRRA